MKSIGKIAIFTFLLLFPAAALASGGGDGHNIVHRMTTFVFQLGIIFFVARLSGMLFEKLSMPSVLGELFAGVLIGPYLLGAISLPAFPLGLFPLAGATFPITTELYGVAVVASIILLFIAGLETDLPMFIQCSLAGTMVGIGGVFFSFVIGVFTGMYFLDAPFMDVRCLFLGAMSTATSVGITARILSERKKMDSPEGVTILAGAVIDDVLGIIILAIVLGIAAVTKGTGSGEVEWGYIGTIAFKAIVVWLGFTALGLIFAHRISAFLKVFKNVSTFSILALGLALILAGVFEKAGLAMIIGAYVMGLSISKTDLSYVIQEKLHPIYNFFVPVFFVVMGMLVNVKAFGSSTVLIFGAVYTAGAIIAKIGGCAIPTMFLGYNSLGALRIGLGMVPRGEVALIIAGIGMSQGILNDEIFGVSIMMTLVTTIVAPPLLNRALKNPAKGTRKDFAIADIVSTDYRFPSIELTDLVATKVISFFEKEGFYIHMMKLDCPIYQIRKDKISLSLSHKVSSLTFDSASKDVIFVKTMMYEALLGLFNTVEMLKKIAKPERVCQISNSGGSKAELNIAKALDPRCVTTELKGNTKEEIIQELVNLLDKGGKVIDKDELLVDVLIREDSMSTGMESGVAIPHAKSDGVRKLLAAVGLKKEGFDFQSMDGEPSNIFILVASRKDTAGPHIQFLAAISSILCSADKRNEILACNTPEEVYRILTKR